MILKRFSTSLSRSSASDEPFQERVRAHIVISGEVQGVGFRAYVKRLADRLDVRGWVRNLDGGGVEAILEGRRGRVLEVIEVCRRGHPFAKIRGIEVMWQPYRSEFNSFRVRV